MLRSESCKCGDTAHPLYLILHQKWQFLPPQNTKACYSIITRSCKYEDSFIARNIEVLGLFIWIGAVCEHLKSAVFLSSSHSYGQIQISSAYTEVYSSPALYWPHWTSSNPIDKVKPRLWILKLLRWTIPKSLYPLGASLAVARHKPAQPVRRHHTHSISLIRLVHSLPQNKQLTLRLISSTPRGLTLYLTSHTTPTYYHEKNNLPPTPQHRYDTLTEETTQAPE